MITKLPTYLLKMDADFYGCLAPTHLSPRVLKPRSMHGETLEESKTHQNRTLVFVKCHLKLHTDIALHLVYTKSGEQLTSQPKFWGPWVQGPLSPALKNRCCNQSRRRPPPNLSPTHRRSQGVQWVHLHPRAVKKNFQA